MAGHDVTSVSDISPRADDAAVLALALRDQRILLTEDRDFGQLVYAANARTSGVILLRFRARDRSLVTRALMEFLDVHADSIAGRFVVVTPGRVRIGPRGQG